MPLTLLELAASKAIEFTGPELDKKHAKWFPLHAHSTTYRFRFIHKTKLKDSSFQAVICENWKEVGYCSYFPAMVQSTAVGLPK
jgi:hypothetical protein